MVTSKEKGDIGVAKKKTGTLSLPGLRYNQPRVCRAVNGAGRDPDPSQFRLNGSVLEQILYPYPDSDLFVPN